MKDNIIDYLNSITSTSNSLVRVGTHTSREHELSWRWFYGPWTRVVRVLSVNTKGAGHCTPLSFLLFFLSFYPPFSRRNPPFSFMSTFNFFSNMPLRTYFLLALFVDNFWYSVEFNLTEIARRIYAGEIVCLSVSMSMSIKNFARDYDSRTIHEGAVESVSVCDAEGSQSRLRPPNHHA